MAWHSTGQPNDQVWTQADLRITKSRSPIIRQTDGAIATALTVHEKAMPVILRTRDEVDVWMNAPRQVALELQRPLPDDALKIVLRDAKEDTALAAS